VPAQIQFHTAAYRKLYLSAAAAHFAQYVEDKGLCVVSDKLAAMISLVSDCVLALVKRNE